MKKHDIACVLLVASMFLFLLNSPLVHAAQMEWGTPLNVNKSVAVGNDEEIPQGQWGWVINKEIGSKTVSVSQWNAMMSGDLSSVAADIDSGIHGVNTTWIQISWDTAVYNAYTQQYTITGFVIQAIVKNNNAGQTGAEIALIIMAVTFLVAITALVVVGSWITVKVMDATTVLGPAVTVLVGLLILGGIGFLLYTFMGGKLSLNSKKYGSVSTGK